jgi:hypothetical protein
MPQAKSIDEQKKSEISRNQELQRKHSPEFEILKPVVPENLNPTVLVPAGPEGPSSSQSTAAISPSPANCPPGTIASFNGTCLKPFDWGR